MQSGSKRRNDEDDENNHPPKKQRHGLSDGNVDKKWLEQELTDIKRGIEKISAEVKEGREVLNNAIELLQEVRGRL